MFSSSKAINEYLAQFKSAFGTIEQVRMFIPMDRTLITPGEVRARLYDNLVGHIRNCSPTDNFILTEFLDDTLMMLAESDQMTIAEAKRLLDAIHQDMPDWYSQYEETLLNNSPSDDFTKAVADYEPKGK